MSLCFRKFFIILVGVAIMFNGALVNIARATNHTSIEQNTFADKGPNSLEMIGCAGQWDALTPSCIVPIVVYYFFYKTAVGLLMLSGYVFDFMMSLSIDREFIAQKFVEKTWGVVRDFTNMTFIFVLLYAGIQTIFGAGNWQRTVMQVVVIALIINFSMFFTKVVIDAGNILAVGMYESIGSEKGDVDGKHKKIGVPERNISAPLSNALQPHSFTSLAASNKSLATMIFIIAAIVSGYVAYVFFKAAFLFMGRIIAFWFLIIISPFALASMAMPKGNIWGWWTNTLLSQAFVAPVFLFFIYLIMFAISGGGPGQGILEGYAVEGSSVFDKMFVPVVVTGMIIYALQKALGVATSMAGEFGGIGMKALNKVVSAAPMGMAANVALGGGAAIAQRTIGQGAGKLLASGTLQEMGARTGWKGLVGRGLMGATERAHTGTFDVRNTGIAKAGIGAIKSGLGVGINIGQGEKESWEKIQKRREKEDKARSKKFEVTDAEKEARKSEINPQYKYAKAREEDEYQKERAAILAHQKAQKDAYDTNEGRTVRAAEAKAAEVRESAKSRTSPAEDKVKAAKDPRSSLKMEGDRLVKRIDQLNKDQKEAEKNLQMGTAKELEEEIKQAEDAKKALDKAHKDAIGAAEKELLDMQVASAKEIEKSEGELKNAQAALAATKAGAELSMAKKALDDAGEKLKATRKTIKETEDELDNWAQSENERRREHIGYVQTATRFYYTRGDREAVVRNIRDTKKKQSKEERAKAKKEKDLVKIFVEAAEKNEKEKGEGEEEKPKAEAGENK